MPLYSLITHFTIFPDDDDDDNNDDDDDNNNNTGTIFIIIQKIREHHTRKSCVRELQKTAKLGTAYILRKVLM
jgi:hypothetical protein